MKAQASVSYHMSPDRFHSHSPGRSFGPSFGQYVRRVISLSNEKVVFPHHMSRICPQGAMSPRQHLGKNQIASLYGGWNTKESGIHPGTGDINSLTASKPIR
jgi:hypothetical protein